MTDGVIELLARRRVLPVLTIHDAKDAPSVAAALVEGGLDVIEITLRTPAALDAIRRASAAVPDAVIGAGSVMSSSEASPPGSSTG